MLKPVICLMGPTASGKTELAISLSQLMPFDIISVDSAMVYRGLDIGSAKPSEAELAKAPHQLIDIREVSDPYSAADFVKDATLAIESSHNASRIPLLVGGTMLYFRALQQGLSTMPPASETIRARLMDEAKQSGWQALHARLALVDRVSANKIKQNDTQRIQRALEVYELTGKPMSTLWAEQQKSGAPFDFISLALFPKNRARLHQRIAQRFKRMLDDGLLNEVAALKATGVNVDSPAMRSVGYRQVLQLLSGEISREQCIEKGIIATRQLAKRQLTWLRSWPDCQCFDPFELDKIDADVMHYLQQHLNTESK